MGTSEIRAGKAFVEIGGKDTSLERVLDRVERRMNSFAAGVGALGKKLMLAGAALAAPLIASVKVFTDVGGQLADMSARTGVSAQGLLVLGQAAKLTGIEIGDVQLGLFGMAKALANAARGGDEVNQALARVGLTLNDLRGLSTEEQFIKIGDAVSKLSDPTVRMATAMKLMGKGGAQLMPMFAQGAAGIEAMRARLAHLAVNVTPEAIASADALGDAFEEVWLQVKFGAFAVGAALAPALSDLTARLQAVLAATIRFIQENQGLVTAVAAVAVGLTAAGAALVPMGVTIKLVAISVGVLSTAFTVLKGTVLAFGAVVTFLGGGPIGMLITALGAVVGTLLWAGGAFEGLGDTANLSIEGIGVAWTQGVNNLTEVWLGFKDAFMGVWDHITGFFLKTWHRTVGLFATGLSFLADGIQALGEMVGLDFGLSMPGERQAIFDETMAELEAIDAAIANNAAARAEASQEAMRANDAELRAMKRNRAEAAQEWPMIDWSEIAGPTPDLSDTLSDLDFGQASQAKQAAPGGTFSAALAARMGAVNAAQEQTASNTQMTVKELRQHTKHLNELIKAVKSGNVAVFAS